MRAHYLQHVPFEGLGSIASWLTDSGYEVSCTNLYESTSLPLCSDIDLLIILGGPMSVNDEEQYPWLRLEKQFIKECIDSGVAVLGICLGAQLIVNVYGETVYPHHRKEIGWFPIMRVNQSDQPTFLFPETVEVFHWHGETFDLPVEATLLASSEACRNQAFQIGNKIIGLQFHLETIPELVENLIAHCSSDILRSKFIQPASVLQDQSPRKYTKINSLMDKVLSFITKGING